MHNGQLWVGVGKRQGAGGGGEGDVTSTHSQAAHVAMGSEHCRQAIVVL